jgi:putative Mg2+ transporter-C (MgtC) family protein
VVKGLTTAASLWTVAAVGLAVGGGLYLAALAATIIILVILAGIKPLEEHFRNGRHAVELHLLAERGSMSVGVLQQALGWRAAHIRQLFVQSGETAGTDDVTVTFGTMPAKDIAETIKSLGSIPAVSDVRQTRP